MSERVQEKMFPFTYDGWDEACGDFGDIQFYKVEFTDDFGPIKKGSKFDCVVVYHCKAELVAVINGPVDVKKEFVPQVGEIVVPFKAVAVAV